MSGARKIYTPTKYHEDAFFNRLNVIVNNLDSQITDVKEYMHEKLDNINEYRTISVFEETEDTTVTPDNSVSIPMKNVLMDSDFTNLSELGIVTLTTGGLYKVEVILDIDGDYTNGAVEMIIEQSPSGESGLEGEEGSPSEVIVKKHYLRESLVNKLIKTFDGGENIKIRVTGGVAEFKVRGTLVVDRLY